MNVQGFEKLSVENLTNSRHDKNEFELTTDCYTPEPRTEVYHFRLNFCISKLVYYQKHRGKTT